MISHNNGGPKNNVHHPNQNRIQTKCHPVDTGIPIVTAGTWVAFIIYTIDGRSVSVNVVSESSLSMLNLSLLWIALSFINHCK